MLETERSSDEALRQPTFVRLYRGAFEITRENDQKQQIKRIQAAYIILLAGRLGLRTGEIQHVRESWIDWGRGEIAIPRHDPCGCKNCWIRASAKATDDNESVRGNIVEIIEEELDDPTDSEIKVHAEMMMNELQEEKEDKNDEKKSENNSATRSAEEILYEERWQPKYERSARRVPFGHSGRLTGIILQFFIQFDCLDITQGTMNRLVKQAAENAENVNPENITIRGLRATAATYYANFIRNPKYLQDVMGWTRIETSARYLRRSGAYTTDIIYSSFNNTDLSPAIFPEEPQKRYPLVTNPVPYQKEPFEPAHPPREYCHSRAESTRSQKSPLIHPRSNNPVENIDYDKSRHDIRTHEDYEDEFIRQDDGSIQTSQNTIAEIFEDHPRIKEEGEDTPRRYQSKDAWSDAETTESDLSEIYDDDDRSLALPGVSGLIAWITARGTEETANEMEKLADPSRVEMQPNKEIGRFTHAESRVAVASIKYGAVIGIFCGALFSLTPWFGFTDSFLLALIGFSAPVLFGWHYFN